MNVSMTVSTVPLVRICTYGVGSTKDTNHTTCAVETDWLKDEEANYYYPHAVSYSNN